VSGTSSSSRGPPPARRRRRAARRRYLEGSRGRDRPGGRLHLQASDAMGGS
jgi:hypothetical protein